MQVKRVRVLSAGVAAALGCLGVAACQGGVGNCSTSMVITSGGGKVTGHIGTSCDPSTDLVWMRQTYYLEARRPGFISWVTVAEGQSAAKPSADGSELDLSLEAACYPAKWRLIDQVSWYDPKAKPAQGTTTVKKTVRIREC